MKEVSDLLEPLQATLTEAHLEAAKRFREMAPATVAALNARERANFLHAQIRALVSADVEDIEGAEVTAWDVDTVAVGSNLLVRFKFLGNGDPANVSTKQQELLARQQYKQETMELLALSGITEPPTIVTCGYTLNGMEIGRILIQRDCKGHDRWFYDIYGGSTVHEPLHLPGIEEAKPAVVRSRKKGQDLGKTGTDKE
jgi:hypothetical protein